VAVALDEPRLVVELCPGAEPLAKLLCVVEGLNPEQLLLERPNEALGAAVQVGRPPRENDYSLDYVKRGGVVAALTGAGN